MVRLIPWGLSMPQDVANFIGKARYRQIGVTLRVDAGTDTTVVTPRLAPTAGAVMPFTPGCEHHYRTLRPKHH